MSAVQLERKRINTTTDRISNLPHDVIQQILERLPLQEAARTSILSSHWRQKWTSISQLILDWGFFSSIQKRTIESRGISLAHSKVVNHILSIHVGPICKFYLYLPFWYSKETDLCKWIENVQANGVKDLTLVGHQRPETKLPTSLFSCVDLTHLTLMRCNHLSLPPSFTGFPCLISLKVETRSCRGSDVCVLETLISRCPQLQSLYLHLLTFDSPCSLTIHAPNIKDIYLRGLFPALCLKGAKMLTTLTLDIGFRHISKPLLLVRQVDEIFGCLTNVEKLVLSSTFWTRICQHYESPKRFPWELGQLRTLKLEGIPLHCQWAIYLPLCLFESTPHLEQLYIYPLYIKASELRKLSKKPSIQIEDSCILPSLKNVQLFGIVGQSGELQLIKFLLENSPLLKEMTIELSAEVGGPAKKFDFAKETTRYRRASPDVEVIINTEKVQKLS